MRFKRYTQETLALTQQKPVRLSDFPPPLRTQRGQRTSVWFTSICIK